jgi:hypothetical protein
VRPRAGAVQVRAVLVRAHAGFAGQVARSMIIELTFLQLPEEPPYEAK